MATFSPQLCSTPGTPVTYNPALAETFSWIPINNDIDRPLFAKAVYSVNRNSQLGQDGFDFIGPGTTWVKNYNAIQTIVSTLIKDITATNSYLGDGTTSTSHLTATILPANFTLYGPIKGVSLQFGAVIGYK